MSTQSYPIFKDMGHADRVEDAKLVMPDMAACINILTQHTNETIGELCGMWGYNGKAYRFSCLACLAHDKRLPKLLPATNVLEYLEQARFRLDAQMVTYREKHGMWPCPAVLLQMPLEAIQCAPTFFPRVFRSSGMALYRCLELAELRVLVCTARFTALAICSLSLRASAR